MFPHRATLIRYVLFATLLSTLFLLYCYLKYRPSYALYDQLSTQESRNSEVIAKTASGGRRRCVMFKQLRGAGFNNQVSNHISSQARPVAGSNLFLQYD